jgi:glycosyltransferase involved in cell wall biosynthesis
MWSDNLTVCLFCYNEENRIEYAIKNFIGKLKILVIDNFSTDRTLEICEKFGVEYVQIDNTGLFVEHPIIMDAVWKHVKTDYMLRTFCGEYVPDELLALYAKVANEKRYDVVCAARISITAGKYILVWGNYRKSTIRSLSPRFSRRDSISYEDNIIYRSGKIVCKEDRIFYTTPQDIHLMYYQFRDYDASWSEVKHGGYNDIEAMQRYRQGERYSFIKMVSKSLAFFLQDYFYNGAYKQGHLGFMHAYYRFHLHMGLYLRLWDMEHNLQKEDITKLHNSIRAKLLAKEIDVESLFK